MAHTQGPWFLNGPWHIHPHTQEGELISVVAKITGEHLPPKEREANAHLIAAAPELLEMVKEFEAAMQVSENYFRYWAGPSIEKVTLVIAKAEGKEPPIVLGPEEVRHISEH